MTTAQESTNGHRVSPPPFSVENPAEPNRADLPTDKANNNQGAHDDPVVERQPGPFAASAYHVPPKLYAPKADSFRDTIPDGLSTMKMPERCQFMFSDGRQCTMARSDIHPSLCTYHSDREDQLFGDPAGSFVTRKLDLPELYSACRDLTTAAGVSRALGQVFRLLAQRRISRQEAATFAKLGHLLLRTISDMRSSRESPAANVYLPAAEVYPQDELPPCNKVELRGVNKSHQELSRVDKVAVACASENKQPMINPTGIVPRNEPERELCPEPSPPYKNGTSARQPVPTNMHPSVPPITPAAGSELHAPGTSAKINTCAELVHNSREINTSENVELKTLQNEHLQMCDPPAMSRRD
jgi:hypothetical protein